MSPKFMALILAAGYVLALYPEPTARGAGQPSPEELSDLAPIFGGLIQDYQSYEVVGSQKMDGVTRMKFCVLFCAPDRYSCLLSDASDGTPIMFIINKDMLVFDPVEGNAILSSNSNPKIIVRNTGNDLFFYYGFSPKQREILIDLKSIFGAKFAERQVSRLGEKAYRLTCTTEKGSHLTASVNLARNCPFERLEITPKNGEESFFAIEKIAVDEEIGDERFAFPPKSRLAEIMPVKELNLDAPFFTRLDTSARLMRTIFVRQAANHPELRDAIKVPGIVEIDWEKVRENDRKYSKPLRDLLQTDTHPSSAPKNHAATPRPGQKTP